MAKQSEALKILDDINGFITGSVGGFFPKYFDAPSPIEFLQWFSSYSSEGFNGARGTWHISCHPGSEPENANEADLFLTLSPTFDRSAKTRWLDVQVIGRFCQNDSNGYQDGLLNLCGHAREVFFSQPTRLFLHGFYICGSLMELWIFDRSGMYSCDVFNVQNEYPRFFSVVVSYRSMTDIDLGRSDIIKNDEIGRYVTLKDAVMSTLDAVMSTLGKIYLEEQAIASSRDIVGEGTTCYRAKLPGSNLWDCVVKFKWRLVSNRPEEELLKLVKEKKVWGVVSLDYHEEIASTGNLRQGLQCGLYRRFLTRQHQAEKSKEGGEQGQSLHRDTKCIIEYTEETDGPFEDRIFTCVIISPAGRHLNTFRTLLELLQVFRDAVKGHLSLYQTAKILHQDVSSENIIITDAQGEENPKGILIDLDVAMELAVGPRTSGELIGTRPFMSIGVLKGRPHTYRHDLESFLYVFLWTIISNRSENTPKTSKLRQWFSKGNWEELATRKTNDMDKDNFANLISEFTPEFHSLKPLVETLRQVLFPSNYGTLWTGTDSSPKGIDELYDGIIGAFEKAIAFHDRK